MYGDAATKLVQHAKRAISLAHVPPYQADLVRTSVREVRALDTSTSSTLARYGGSFDPSSDPGAATGLLVEYMCMRRNKRCLLAYHRQRVEKVQEMVWRGVDLLEQQGEDGGERNDREDERGGGLGKSSLSPEEEEYARAYGELLAAYKGQWTDIDLTGSLEPPKDLFIDVRVLKDAGEIQTEYGAINLTKNSQFFVRQGDVERLIAQGYLQKLT